VSSFPLPFFCLRREEKEVVFGGGFFFLSYTLPPVFGFFFLVSARRSRWRALALFLFFFFSLRRRDLSSLSFPSLLVAGHAALRLLRSVSDWSEVPFFPFSLWRSSSLLSSSKVGMKGKRFGKAAFPLPLFFFLRFFSFFFCHREGVKLAFGLFFFSSPFLTVSLVVGRYDM